VTGHSDRCRAEAPEGSCIGDGCTFTPEDYPGLAETLGVHLWPSQRVTLPLGHHAGKTAQRKTSDLWRSAIDSMHARYEPTGLVLHPLDHGVLMFEGSPKTAEDIAIMKRIADSFGVPYWTVGIPGYPAPFKVRVKRHLRAMRRTGRRIVLAIPGVNDYARHDWGWGPPAGWREPRTGWNRHYRETPAATRFWVRVGDTVLGRYEPPEW
jgi:hypothetical protein